MFYKNNNSHANIKRYDFGQINLSLYVSSWLKKKWKKKKLLENNWNKAISKSLLSVPPLILIRYGWSDAYKLNIHDTSDIANHKLSYALNNLCAATHLSACNDVLWCALCHRTSARNTLYLIWWRNGRVKNAAWKHMPSTGFDSDDDETDASDGDKHVNRVEAPQLMHLISILMDFHSAGVVVWHRLVCFHRVLSYKL